jgi:hypothetical protein
MKQNRVSFPAIHFGSRNCDPQQNVLLWRHCDHSDENFANEVASLNYSRSAIST